VSLYYIAIAFHVWMIVDAIRRRAEFYWFLVILLVPLGSVAYFFLVKAQDFEFARKQSAASEPVSLPKLRFRALETPSVQNKLVLADQLEGHDQYAEATDLYREVLRRDTTNKQALHGLARCLLGMGQPALACDELAKLLDVDSGYRDYSAALDYAEALWQSDQQQDAIDLLQGLVGVSSRINHRVALAHYLILADRTGPAKDELDKALREHEHSLAYVKKRDKNWAERAHKMLAELG